MNASAHTRRAVLGSLAAALGAVAIGAPAPASAAGFGQISGPGGCLMESGSSANTECGAGEGLFHPEAVAISPDGTNVYVVGGITRSTISASFGSLTILRRNPATGEVTDSGCLSSDGTDGRDGASGLCTPMPSLLGADGVTVSADGKTVFVTARDSASVVAFARDPTTGALTRLGCLQAGPHPGSPCTAANLFYGAEHPLASANGSTLYVTSEQEGTISAFAAPAAPPSEPSSTLASLFTTTPGPFVADPCIAVNGYDGTCAVGVAMKGVTEVVPSPEGNQLYAVATVSHAVDVFAPAGKEGLVQTGCLMADAPAGLCNSSALLQSPESLAISPDGRNVYVAEQAENGGRIDVLSRNATTGQLADVGCVDYLPQPVKAEPGEEEHEEEQMEKEPPDTCERVPGLESVETLAISADGSAVYAFGKSSAVSFTRDPATGALTETACASDSDSRCAGLNDLSEVEGAAVSPDGRDVYVVSAGKHALIAFGIGAAVTSATAATTHAGVALVGVSCPAHLARACRGRLALTRLLDERGRRHGRHTVRVLAGSSGTFAIGAGRQAVVAVRLAPSAQRLLHARRRLRVTATVRAEPLSGGSGLGRRIALRLDGPQT
jgi:DNA-binding beta-propeller fold protein YncE